jgi:2'-5' RNA ligase
LCNVASTKRLTNPSSLSILQSWTSGSDKCYYWQEIVRKNEDLDAVAERIERAERAEGIYTRKKEFHETPTARRKRIKGLSEYRIKKEKVMDVVRYVKWKRNLDKK